MHLSDFDYDLPQDLIAQYPSRERAASRLLHLDGKTGAMEDRVFRDIVRLVAPGDVLVVNDTRVIKARLHGRKDTGGEVEVLVERVLDAERVLAQVRASKAPKAGGRLILAEGDVEADVLGRQGEFFELHFGAEEPVLEILARHGETPLPPYISHIPDADDEARYQTVYARNPGAVAAPTAGLHFDKPLLTALEALGVILSSITLHVGAGTFQPVRSEEIAEHRMHAEWYSIPPSTAEAVAKARKAGKRVIAVGTTALRALESAAAHGSVRAGTDETRLFIMPGHEFRAVDALVTNFHLPRSTLLMLVCAFGGVDNVRRAYAHAVEHRYRFFSYGDAMFLSSTAGARGS